MGFYFDKMSVLVVEDTLPMRTLVTTVLETLGVGRVFTATDGEAGFQLFCAKNPDVVITDWHMEPVNGIDLVKRIRISEQSTHKTVPIIMMSGYSAYPRVSMARDVGVTEFLVKPFSTDDLAKSIAYVINKPRDFVVSNDYFGPDRRRRMDDDYSGKMKRESDRNKVYL